MTHSAPRTAGPIFSSRATEPEFTSLVDRFVDDLPDRVQAMLDMLQASDSDGLRRAAHQMMGTAVSHGFHEITVEAAAVEAAICEARPEIEITATVNTLIDICRRARRGNGTSRTELGSFR